MNLLRVTVAFSLMLVPATAMGLTLPLLAKALTRFDVNFGRVLGRLYGWNTLGGNGRRAGRRALADRVAGLSVAPRWWPARSTWRPRRSR